MSQSITLVHEFEKSFQGCLQQVAGKEISMQLDSDEEKASLDQCLEKFVEKAQQLESYFLRKGHVYAVCRPELVIKAENAVLRAELKRKEELLAKHSDHLAQWLDQLRPPQHANSSDSQVQQSQMQSQGQIVMDKTS